MTFVYTFYLVNQL